MSRTNRGNCRRWIVWLGVALGLLAAVVGVQSAQAHPLGNFTVNQYARFEVTETETRIVYVLDMAEVPAFQEIQNIDLDGDGEISSIESDAYLETLLPAIEGGLELTVDGRPIALTARSSELSFPDGQAGLKLLRLRVVFGPTQTLTPAIQEQSVELVNSYATDRIGWREILVTHGENVTIGGVVVPQHDASTELTRYPADLLKSPLDENELTFTVKRAPGASAAAGYTALSTGMPAATGSASRPDGGSTGGHLAALVNRDDLSATGMFIALFAAAVWGAAHALSPGHGKTVVGAYLIGSRGTPRHAVFLGTTVTITHTAGVIALGLITLFASRYIVPETLFPWLSAVSGGLVILMGLWTLRLRLRNQLAFGHHHHDAHEHTHAHADEHDHDHVHELDGLTHSHGGHTHSHLPPEQISWRGLAALGISGGLIPCPSALIVLLGSIALGRIGFGLALVVAFSLGLAFTLTALGIVFLHAGRLLEGRMSPDGRVRSVLRFGPAAGSVALTLAGILIIVRALGQTSLR